LGLFQSDHDLDIMGDLSDEAGCNQLEKDAKIKTGGTTSESEAGDEDDRIYYCIHGGYCSDPELVRKHLDSGVLEKLIKEKEAKLLAIPDPKKYEWHDPCYVYVLLGACTMTLGCQLPDSYISMLKKVYREGGLMPDAQKQMHKALFGPAGYQNGVPYDFRSKSLVETANSTTGQPNSSGFIGMNVIGPGGFFNTGMGDSTTSEIIKELRSKHDKPGACGNCGIENGQDGRALLNCSRCKNRKYCSKECQKKHWKVHKKVCDSVG
ncbi:hypothetical protein BDV96DRAFT_678206, partial [Lophiotrema nucula]